MTKKIKNKICPVCSTEFEQKKIGQKHCSPKCFYSVTEKKKSTTIKKVSEKRKKENLIYSERRKLFLSINKICFIDGCSLTATTIEHTKGRTGYADEWARENKISLFLDERFWKGCCWKHNGELENNTELSHKYQLSKIHNGTKGELK